VLLGLSKILLDIDRAITIIRETDEENEVVPNLMIGFGIDEIQADYVAEIKLRHINREYIIKRTEEIEDLKKAIAEAEEILGSEAKIRKIIINDLREIAAKYGKERKTEMIYTSEEEAEGVTAAEESAPEYPVNLFLTAEGYFKKITPQSLRMSSEHKLKEGDKVTTHIPSETGNNRDELLFFTDKGVAYKSRASEFDDVKASVMGDYIPSKLEFDDDEKLLSMIVTSDYSEMIISFFQNGKCAKVPLSSFVTKTKRKKLANSLNTDSPLIAMFKISDDCEFVLKSVAGKVMIFSSALILPKTTRDTQGVQVMRLTKTTLESAVIYEDGIIRAAEKYRTKAIPVAGVTGNVQLQLGE
ncbi:MAG: topoisomerase IV, partial [Oscillospiraceae bacterium]|nr:topoisomerase IV [Oscillospiraceae bacterium]